MIKMTKRFPGLALIALLLVFAGCKGESPTAPPPGGSNPPGGGTPPPTGVTLSLNASNTDPLVDSTVTVTATVAQDGQPVPNGTAVEFSTSNGTFLDTATNTTIRTTTNGVATATLTSATAGASRITATVNNVTRTVDVTFRPRSVNPPVTPTSPTITSITPNIGRPSGGETIRITGTNLRGPVRVLFDVGGALPVEGFVVSRSDTAIEVVTPAVNLGAGQQLVSRVTVITEAGSTTEQRVDVAAGFTFRNESLTPRVSTATPNSGPVVGGTRVTIIGDGFQAPVQVLFGSAEARVIEVRYAEIIVEAPAGRDTSPDGTGPVTGPVDITIVNINSQTRVTLAGGFRYVAAMQITAVGPTEGLFTGGTRVTIDGNGFVAPVAVTIGGIAAQPIFVSGTRIIAITSPVAVTSCADVSGPIAVTNISNGDSAAFVTPFTFRVLRPLISNVVPPAVLPGETVTVTVANAQPGTNRITLGDRVVFATPVFLPDGSATFTITVPTNLTFATQACTLNGGTGTQQIPLSLSVTYLNVQTGCTDTVANAVTINPCNPMPCPCVTPPNAVVSPAACPAVNVMTPNPVASAGAATATSQLSVTNTGSQPLTLTSIAPTGSPVNAVFSVTLPGTNTILPGQTVNVTVVADPAAPGAYSGTIRVTTNDPDTPNIDVCFSGTAS
jgi:IPT/TIG domain